VPVIRDALSTRVLVVWAPPGGSGAADGAQEPAAGAVRSRVPKGRVRLWWLPSAWSSALVST